MGKKSKLLTSIEPLILPEVLFCKFPPIFCKRIRAVLLVILEVFIYSISQDLREEIIAVESAL